MSYDKLPDDDRPRLTLGKVVGASRSGRLRRTGEWEFTDRGGAHIDRVRKYRLGRKHKGKEVGVNPGILVHSDTGARYQRPYDFGYESFMQAWQAYVESGRRQEKLPEPPTWAVHGADPHKGEDWAMQRVETHGAMWKHGTDSWESGDTLAEKQRVIVGKERVATRVIYRDPEAHSKARDVDQDAREFMRGWNKASKGRTKPAERTEKSKLNAKTIRAKLEQAGGAAAVRWYESTEGHMKRRDILIAFGIIK